MRRTLALLGCIAGALAAKGKVARNSPFVDPLKHDILIITAKNFDASINKYRDRFPGAMLFYNEVDEARDQISEVWDALAKQLKGMAKIGAVSCTEFPQFCKAQSVALEAGASSVKIYPPLPAPPFVYEGKFEKTKLASSLVRLIPPAKIEVVQSDKEMATFLGQSPAIPKVFLFTDKPKASPMFTSLAHSFSDRMNFATIVGPADSDMTKKFRVKKLPTLMIKKGDLTASLRGVQVYKGPLTFHDLHEWINVHSETFVKGGGFITDAEPTPEDISVVRPWLLQKVPELTKGSHHEVCFKKSNGLCAVYVKHGALTDSEKEMIEKMSEDFSAEGKVAFHWSWLDVETEANYAKLLKMSPQEGEEVAASKSPSFVIFNPHKKLRFSKIPNDVQATRDTMASFIQKIISGDGRFSIIKGNRVPAFVVRKRKEADAAAAPSSPSPAAKNDEL